MDKVLQLVPFFKYAEMDIDDFSNNSDVEEATALFNEYGNIVISTKKEVIALYSFSENPNTVFTVNISLLPDSTKGVNTNMTSLLAELPADRINIIIKLTCNDFF